MATLKLLLQAIYSINVAFTLLHYDISTADTFLKLLELEAQHGAPSQYTPAISQIIEYYKKVTSWLYSKVAH